MQARQVKSESEKPKLTVSDSDTEEFETDVTVSSFALLDVESGSEDEETSILNDTEQKESKDSKQMLKNKKVKVTNQTMNNTSANNQQDAKKKKGKKKTKVDEDDEELDRMLQELQLESKENDNKQAQDVAFNKKESKKAIKKKSKQVLDHVDTKEEGYKAVSKLDVTDEKTKIKNSDSKDPKADKEGDLAGDTKKKKGPNKAMVAMMQERLKQMKEEEDKLKVSKKNYKS